MSLNINEETDMLKLIIKTKERLQEVQADLEKRNVAIDKVEILKNIIKELSKIIEDNSNEKEHKNIGIKISKYNYDKYVNCKVHLQTSLQLLKEFGRIEDLMNQVVTINIYAIEDAICEIQRRIDMYDNSKN